MTKKLISVGLAPDVVKIVDNVRGDIPRSLYLRKLITEVIYKKVNGNLTNVLEQKEGDFSRNVWENRRKKKK